MAGAVPVEIGLFADIQHSDRDTFKRRNYRQALTLTELAVRDFNARNLSAVVNLGDIIDASCTWVEGDTSVGALERVLNVLGELTVPRYDLIGNHELANFAADQLLQVGLNFGSRQGSHRTYYMESYGRWNLIFLDTFEHHIPDDAQLLNSEKGQQSLEVLRRQRADPVEVDTTASTWFQQLYEYSSPDERHLTPRNGAMSEEQLRWLRAVLTGTERDGKQAILFSHAPLCDTAFCKPWNWREIMDVVQEFHAIIHAVFSGHLHHGQYHVDVTGIHHLSLKAIVEAKQVSPCWAVLELHQASVWVVDFGALPRMGREDCWLGQRIELAKLR